MLTGDLREGCKIIAEAPVNTGDDQERSRP
jgi:hypothetical protein